MPPLDTLTPFYLWDTATITPEFAQPVFVGLDMIDSVFAPREGDTLALRPSFLAPHSFQSSSMQPALRDASSASAWAFAALVALVALLTLFFHQHKLRLPSLLASLFSQRARYRTLRDSNLSRSATLFLPALMLLATLTVVVAHFFALSPLYVLALFAILSVLYLLRNGIIRLMGTIYDSSAATSAYITTSYLHHLALAVLMLPFAFLYLFSPSLSSFAFYALLLLVGAELIVRWLNANGTFFSHTNAPHIHLFYYLCTVELLPIIVLIKQIIS